MDITTHVTGGGDVIFMVDGELELASVPVLHVYVRSLSADPPCRRAVLDLTWLRFCDATGANSLRAVQRTMVGQGIAVAMIEPTEPLVRRVLHITGVSRRIPVLADDDLATPAPAAAYAHEPAGC